MLKLKLKAVHRFLVLGMLDEAGKAGSSLSEVNKLLKFVDVLDFTPDERRMLNIRLEDGLIKWNARADGEAAGEIVDVEREFEITDEQKIKLLAIMQRKDEDKKFTTSDAGPVMELAEQIGYKFE